MIKRCVAKSSTYVRAEVAAHGSTQRRWLDMRWVVGVHSHAAGDSLESNSLPTKCPRIRDTNCSLIYNFVNLFSRRNDDRELILQAFERNTALSPRLETAVAWSLLTRRFIASNLFVGTFDDNGSILRHDFEHSNAGG